MTLSVQEARDLARATVEQCAGDDAEVLVAAGSEALTRFANSRINQNVSVDDAVVHIRSVVGKRQGGATTNRLDGPSLTAACEAAHAAAANSPEDPDFPGLPDAHEWLPVQRAQADARAFGPDARAEAVRGLVSGSAGSDDLTCAGKVEVADSVVAIASSRGVDAYATTTEFAATVLSMRASGGSGWSSFAGPGVDGFDPGAMGLEAARTALASVDASELAPGDYSVVLGPEAVGEILTMLAYTGLSAKAFAEERSFMSGRMGETLMSPSISITDDALSPEAGGLTFDYEGQPKRRVELVASGVARAVVTDSYWAAKLGMENTGHALPAPNAFGPYPLDLSIEAGDASVDELVSSVKRGVFVTRFWYVNVDNPVRVDLTGMTRDGTFLIEDGALAGPIKNLRFTQSAVEALSHVGGVGAQRKLVGDRGGGVRVPALLLERFAFTGQTG